MSLLSLFDAKTALLSITIVASIGVIISTMEYLSSYHIFKNDSILSWQVSKYAKRWYTSRYIGPILDSVLSYSRFKWVLYVRAFSALIAIILAVGGIIHPLPFFFVLITTFSVNLRNPFGLDGAHQMTIVIFSALFISSLVPTGSPIRIVSLWFIALQAVLSYLIAGLSKAVSEVWRDGSALLGIFGTTAYGHNWVYEQLNRNRWISTVLCWTTIAFECMFPLVFIDARFGALLVLCGVIFHLFTAVFMGLNNFFFAFVATYPAVLYVSLTTSSFLGWT